MKKRNGLVAISVGLAMVATTTMPAFAATGNSNHSGSGVQSKLNKNLNNAQKWAEKQTQKLLGGKDPTAAQVTAGLLKTYAKIQVWPKGLINPPSWGSSTPTPAYWQTGVKKTPSKDWVGLKTVFPGKPSSQWPKLLGMTNAPKNKPITAATLAKWVLDWEIDAHKVNTDWEPTKNAFNLLRLYNFFYGTNLTKPTTMVDAHDLAEVENNIVEVSQGYRMLAANKVQLLMPMINHTGDVMQPIDGGYFTRSNWPQKGIGPTVREFDSITFTFEPGGNAIFDYNTHLGDLVVLHYNFVKNGSETGNGGPIQDEIPIINQWLTSSPIPLTLHWNQGQYLEGHYSGISVPNIKNTFFVSTFCITNSYLERRFGEAAMALTPSYVISQSKGKIIQIGIVAGQTFPELTWYGIGR